MNRLVPDLPDEMDWAILTRKARVIIDELSPLMQTVLARHALGPQPFPRGLTETTVMALRVRGLLKLVGLWTANWTAPTDIGRVVIVILLADEAESLIDKEMLEQEAQFDREQEREALDESMSLLRE